MRDIRLHFHVALIALLGTAMAATALGMILVQVNGARTIVHEAALAYMDVVGDRAADHVSALLDPVGDALRILASRSALRETASPSDRDLIPGLIETVGVLPSVYGLFLGYDDRSFTHIESMSAIPPALRATAQIPEGAAYRLTEIRWEGGRRVQRRRWLDAAAAPFGDATVTEDPPFDPTERPWYRDMPAGAPISLSKPYVFYTLRAPGYTVSVPIAGKIHGVLAADILLSSFEDFLKAQRISPNARVVLLDETGAVAAGGGLSDILRRRSNDEKTDTLSAPHLSALDYPALEAAWDEWRRKPRAHETVSVDGRVYIASIRRVASTLSTGFRVVTIAPLDEFFGAIESLRFRLHISALAIMLLAVPLAVVVGRRVGRELIVVADEARKIREFQLDPTPPIRSRLLEIDQLADSVGRAKSAVDDFARFVPRALVRQLVESGTKLELGGERRRLTILFTDAVDFTALSERTDPAELMRNASRYLAALSTAITDHDGTVDKYIGDAIMAFWNAPLLDSDHVAHACEAVLACIAASSELNGRFAEENWPAMQTRYGLHVGEVIVGNIGSDNRMNYTAIGAAVNLASRLEGLNAHYGTEVLVSEAIVEAVDDRFLFRRIDRVLPKGIAEPITIYSLVGTKRGDRTRCDRALREGLTLWGSVMADWDNRDWTAALRGVERFLRCRPADGVALKYRERCLAYLRDPPSPDDDTVTRFLDK